MSKQDKQFFSLDSTDKLMTAEAAQLPDDNDELLEIARASVQAHHNAVFIGNWDLMIQTANRYEAVIWKLNCSFLIS